MAKVLSKVTLKIGQGVAPTTLPGVDTFDTVGNLTNLAGLEITKDDVEITDMDSTVKEFFGDLANPGSLTFTCNRNYGNAGQTAIRSGSLEQVLRNIRVERLDPADDSVLETLDFVGEVMEYSEDASQGAPATLTGRIKAVQDITFT